MPSFMFAAGFSYRLTMLRRCAQGSAWPAYRHAIMRSFAIILLSAMMFSLDLKMASFSEMTSERVREYIAEVLKAKLWNVLAIIGAAQFLLLPVITSRAWVRVLTLVAFMLIHATLSHLFNYEFVYGRPNAMDPYWGAATTRAWDGGFFGVLMWAVPMLAGTLAYDIVHGKWVMGKLVTLGLAMMLVGYLASCLTTLYDKGAEPISPVIPSLEQLNTRSIGSLLAEPPFVPVPPPEARMHNYWMMDKRVVTITFTMFSTGFAFVLYGLFVFACDHHGASVDLFRVLGQNPLAAYLLHYPILKTIRSFVPNDSPMWWCLVSLAVFLGITTMFVRYLDRQKLYLRL
jgi:hypothetical protein